ncbi:LysR family transcriptional regulator [Acidiphilium multivorum AIU301]|uniref:LysR family transcriptional regulator n=1 Tax=Acidiphilium multivorum (strain DSM 11245 / JCM 8867 / NBRC 100883 / AIU 301) TaxID=926570 RepID=F0J288_ACIMA|nr:LysR family transcriptional regulator [Acidiphilium multivorum]UNC13800.1 LysR family transcriptional regulator [Acidiphilium multivorum]BAJ81832.1 LysR family transcriptional regulator [Acidiphilium multivorum AIU301]GAN75585.1 transcriptional regulator LysR [Acidiphilium multivorum AIU301]
MDRLVSMSVFVAAVEEGSLVGAGRRFGLSPSMAGKHVSAIEDQLGVRLLQRSTRVLKLTDVGQAYFKRCKLILEDYEDANREAQRAHQTVRGVLRVAAPTTFGAIHLGPVVARYLAAYPEVTVETTLSDRYVDLLMESIDVAIRIGRLKDSDLVAQRLAPCHMVFCAAPSFLARHGVPKTVEQLRQAPRVAFTEAVSAGDWTLTDPSGRTHLIDGPLRLAVNNMQMLLAAALAGIGVAYGPSFVFGESIASGTLQILMSQHKTSELAIHAIYPTKRHVSLKLRRFIEHLQASFGTALTLDPAHRI